MNIAIIGAGASGLFLANLLEKLNIKYTLFNKGKVGSKILASGNGRCNISNKNLDYDKYHNNAIAKYLIDNYKDKLYKSFDDLTSKNINATFPNLTIIFLVIVFLNSSIPKKNQFMSSIADIINSISIIEYIL